MLLNRCVRLNTLAGEARSIWVNESETLGSAAPRILEAYNRSLHHLKLLNDETLELIEDKDAQPFMDGHSEFAPVFWWESTWSHELHGTLLASRTRLTKEVGRKLALTNNTLALIT